jgi:transposase
MSRKAKQVTVAPDDRIVLESWVRASSCEQRLALRASIVLAASEGATVSAVASECGVTSQTVGKWRDRYLRSGIDGLSDAPRSGKPAKYDAQTERRVLAKLDETPPEGYATWTGSLLAEALGDVSDTHVWRVLQARGIHLQRRRSWCISTDPQFVPKAADIVALYLSPPEGAVVISVDEKPHIQALERAQGWLKLPNGKALSGYSHEYKRHGTTTLFAALEVATGQVKAAHYNRRRRVEFLDFMNDVVGAYPSDTQLHVVLDNLNTHKPKDDRWLRRHPNVHFHFTPTHASWLNQVETWFSILSDRALRGASFTSPRQVRQAIDRFIQAYNPKAHPFHWTKKVVHQVKPTVRYADLCD